MVMKGKKLQGYKTAVHATLPSDASEVDGTDSCLAYLERISPDKGTTPQLLNEILGNLGANLELQACSVAAACSDLPLSLRHCVGGVKVSVGESRNPPRRCINEVLGRDFSPLLFLARRRDTQRARLRALWRVPRLIKRRWPIEMKPSRSRISPFHPLLQEPRPRALPGAEPPAGPPHCNGEAISQRTCNEPYFTAGDRPVLQHSAPGEHKQTIYTCIPPDHTADSKSARAELASRGWGALEWGWGNGRGRRRVRRGIRGDVRRRVQVFFFSLRPHPPISSPRPPIHML